MIVCSQCAVEQTASRIGLRTRKTGPDMYLCPRCVDEGKYAEPLCGQCLMAHLIDQHGLSDQDVDLIVEELKPEAHYEDV